MRHSLGGGKDPSCMQPAHPAGPEAALHPHLPGSNFRQPLFGVPEGKGGQNGEAFFLPLASFA